MSRAQAGVHVGVEADLGGVDHDVGALGHGVVAGPGGVDDGYPGLAFEEVDQGLALRRVAADDGDLAHAHQGHLDRDGAGGAARAQEHHGLAGGICEAADAGDEALAVGVLADQLVVAGDHAIDRTHQRRGITEAVQVGVTQLVRVVVEARKPIAAARRRRGEVGGATSMGVGQA